MYAIEIQHLNKSYGSLKAVQDLSFHVKKGEFFAFLGVNGAGKSTTISILCGQQNKDSGIVLVNGKEVDTSKIGYALGVVFQESVLDKPLTVKENLKNRAALYGIYGRAFDKRLQELIDLFDFSNYVNQNAGKLSGGQRRRIDIARALIHKPEILILDEPTTGLDPQTRKNIWKVIEKLQKEEGLTVLLTTHYMEEATKANSVLIIDKGQSIAWATPHELKKKYAQDTIYLYGVNEDVVKSLHQDYIKTLDGYQIKVTSTAQATKLILAYPNVFQDYEVIKGNMDDVFLTATGKVLGEHDEDNMGIDS